MGAGTAKVAAEKCPELPGWYGRKCKTYKGETAVTVYKPGRMFLFPTKPLDEDQPWLSWKNDADLNLIKRSAKQLAALVTELTSRGSFFTKIGVPLVGCQNGNLNRRDVVPILKEFLDDRFVLLERS
jgi:hypothetical protein